MCLILGESQKTPVATEMREWNMYEQTFQPILQTCPDFAYDADVVCLTFIDNEYMKIQIFELWKKQ